MITLLVSAALASADPWGRPTHLRAVAQPPQTWSMLYDDRIPVRLWWDESDQPVEIQAFQRNRWKTIERSAEPGWISRPLDWGTWFRVRHGEGRWSEPVQAPLWWSPVDLARLAGPENSVLTDEVGQVVVDGRFVWASTLGGGVVRAESGRRGVDAWTRWEGLPDDRVIALDVDGDAVLAGTAQGAALLRDGRVVQVWDSVLPDPYVQSVLLGDSIWLGTYQGLARVDGDSVASVLEPWSVFSLSQAIDGGVWVGYEGLHHVSSETGEVSQIEGLTERNIYSSLDLGSALWIASEENGVEQVIQGEILPATGYPQAQSYGLTNSPLGVWAAGGSQGLIGPNGQVLDREIGLLTDTVWSVAGQGFGMWVGTSHGLAWLQLDDRGDLQNVISQNFTLWPASADTRALLLGKRGLWVGGARGLWALQMPGRHGLDLVVASEHPVVSLVQAGTTTWAVGKHAISINRRGQLHRVQLPAPAKDATFWSDTLWIASDSGLWRYEHQGDRFVRMVDLPDVTKIDSDSHALWVIARGGAIFRVVFGSVRPFAQAHDAYDIDSAGEYVCLGTTNGLERLWPEEDGAVEDVLGQADAGVSVPAVAVDRDGGCWFAAEDGTVGRALLDGQVVTTQLPEPNPGWPTQVVVDGEDRAWVLTDKGTWRVRLPLGLPTLP